MLLLLVVVSVEEETQFPLRMNDWIWIDDSLSTRCSSSTDFHYDIQLQSILLLFVLSVSLVLLLLILLLILFTSDPPRYVSFPSSEIYFHTRRMLKYPVIHPWLNDRWKDCTALRRKWKMPPMINSNTKPLLFAPSIQVLWFRNSFSIQPTDRHLMTSRNGRHMLHIKNLQTEDFGNYRYVQYKCKHQIRSSCSPDYYLSITWWWWWWWERGQPVTTTTRECVHPTPVGLFSPILFTQHPHSSSSPSAVAWPRTRWAAWRSSLKSPDVPGLPISSPSPGANTRTATTSPGRCRVSHPSWKSGSCTVNYW